MAPDVTYTKLWRCGLCISYATRYKQTYHPKSQSLALQQMLKQRCEERKNKHVISYVPQVFWYSTPLQCCLLQRTWLLKATVCFYKPHISQRQLLNCVSYRAMRVLVACKIKPTNNPHDAGTVKHTILASQRLPLQDN